MVTIERSQRKKQQYSDETLGCLPYESCPGQEQPKDSHATTSLRNIKLWCTALINRNLLTCIDFATDCLPHHGVSVAYASPYGMTLMGSV